MNNITIDKTGWKKWRFDEFAQNISERIEPSQTDLDVYVGLEHIDPDTLHLSRHGHPSDVEGTKLRFYKGDIIFGRRRAYQRKTALATTNGICSAHAMVLRAKEDVVDPSFFPFLFHSKQFIDIAITISVGGLSPTINWKDISKQEFLLPPKSEQKRLAELLWATDEMIEKEKKVVYKVQGKINLTLSNILGVCKNGYYSSKKHESIKVAKVLLNNKFNVGKLDTKDYQEYGLYPIIDQSKNEIAAYSNNKEYLYNGTLPVLIFGDHTTAIKHVDFPFILGADGTKILLANEDIVLTKYLYYAIQNLNIVPQGYRRHYSILKDLEIPLLSIENQKELISQLDTMESLIKQQEQVLSISQQLKQKLINKIF